MTRRLGQKKKDLVDQNERWHPYIATPAYDGKVDVDFATSIGETMFTCPLKKVLCTFSAMGNGAFIDLSRNVFVKMFLEREELKDCTHLFFIDADLKWAAGDFIGLVRSGHPVVAGIYPRRQSPRDYPIKLSENPDVGGMWMDGDWLFADRVPTGFLCIRRDIVEEMAKDAIQLNLPDQDGPVPRLFYTYVDDDNQFVGEDFAWCNDYVKKYGEPIRVWPNMTFTHGGYEGNLLDFLEEKLEAAGMLAEASTPTTSAA